MNTIELQPETRPRRWFVYGPDGALIGEVEESDASFYVVGVPGPYPTPMEAAQTIP